MTPDPEYPEPLPEDGANYYQEPSALAGTPVEQPAMHNAADREQVKAQEKSAKRQRDLRRETIKAIMQHANGREFLAWLIFDVAVLNSPLAASSFNPEVVHFFAGRRQVGLDLQHEALQADRNGYMLMLQEHLKG